MKLLRKGFSPQTALEAILKEDKERETRQVVIIDKEGRSAVFTGKETSEWKGHLASKDYAVAGNLLAGKEVIEDMAQTFEDFKGTLAEKLLAALEAGQDAGGDKRGETSAALLVVDKELAGLRPSISLRVDVHREPVEELRRIFVKHSKVQLGNHRKQGWRKACSFRLFEVAKSERLELLSFQDDY